MRHKLIEQAVKLRIQIDRDLDKHAKILNKSYEALWRIRNSLSAEELKIYYQRVSK